MQTAQGNLKRFFKEMTSAHNLDPSHGLGLLIHKKLSSNNAFDTVSDRQVNYWLEGTKPIGRMSAYRLCIACNIDINNSEILFEKYLGKDFVRFNDWREVLYYYCISKRYDLNKTFELYQQCINEIGLDRDDAGASDGIIHSVTIITHEIKEAFLSEGFNNDESFFNCMALKKDKFHRVIGGRRRYMIDILRSLGDDKRLDMTDAQKIKKGKEKLKGELTKAFHLSTKGNKRHYHRDDEGYFSKFLDKIEQRKTNFNRDFFILCLLIDGMNTPEEIHEVLTDTVIGYTTLRPKGSFFDSCVLEACKRSKSSGESAYTAFCKITSHKYKCERPLRISPEEEGLFYAK